MLQLRRARERVGVCLQDWRPLLVPGAGSGDARCWGEKLDDEAVAVVVVFSCRVLLSATAITKISAAVTDHMSEISTKTQPWDTNLDSLTVHLIPGPAACL